MSLRFRIVLLLLAILVPAFASFAWITTRNMQKAQDTLREQVLSRAQAIRVSMDQELERRETVLRLLLNSPELTRWDMPAFCRLARSTVRDETGTLVLARERNIFLGTTQPDCTPRPNGMRRIPDAISPGPVFVTDIFKRTMGDELMAMFLPFEREGATHQLGIAVRPESLQEKLALNRFDPSWSVVVLNAKGRVLARMPDPDQWIGKYALGYSTKRSEAERFWRDLAPAGEGSEVGRTPEGVPLNVVYSRSGRYGLTVFIGYPQAVALDSAHATVLEETLIAAGLMLLGLLLAAWASGKIADPAEALLHAAENLKAARPVALERYGLPEFDSVAESMEEASATIRSHNAEMQRRVEEAVLEARESQTRLMQAQKLEVIGRLSGGIAHDFNNLLQTLSTCLTLLEQMVREPRSKPLVEAGLRAVDRASRLVQQLLALGRNVPFARQPVDLHAQLLGMEVLLSRTLVGNVRLHVDLAPGLWRVLTDPAQLEVALLNLVFNARDALPTGGTVTLSAANHLHEGREGVLLSVADEGEGIAPDLVPRIFEPFVTTKPVGRGTGLGLSQVRDFALASEGSVGVDSTQGVGTTVKLWLPRSLDEVAELHRAPEAVAVRGGRVLLVEDDGLISEVVSSALQDAGFRVQRCLTADEALRCLRAGDRPDVVFSDVLTGGSMDGFQLVDALHREFPQVPVVLATGYSESRRGSSTCVVLSKPYSLPKLIETLDAVMKAPDTAAV